MYLGIIYFQLLFGIHQVLSSTILMFFNLGKFNLIISLIISSLIFFSIFLSLSQPIKGLTSYIGPNFLIFSLLFPIFFVFVLLHRCKVDVCDFLSNSSADYILFLCHIFNIQKPFLYSLYIFIFLFLAM